MTNEGLLLVCSFLLLAAVLWRLRDYSNQVARLREEQATVKELLSPVSELMIKVLHDREDVLALLAALDSNASAEVVREKRDKVADRYRLVETGEE